MALPSFLADDDELTQPVLRSVLGWGTLTLGRGDPITAAIEHRTQHRLRQFVAVRKEGCRVDHGVVGVLRIPKIGLQQIVVQGTGKGDLDKGPGHYPATGLPGDGRVIAIAGHRTTWAHPSATSTPSDGATD